jgi:dihydrofolate reductase
MKISFVVAVSDNDVIGDSNKNKIVWDIPEDYKHFVDITRGHTVLMGRKTFDSIIDRIGKPLSKRTSVVITRKKDWQAPEGVLVYNDIETALKNIKVDELMVIGGGQIYKEFLDKDLVDKIYMTHIHMNVDGDVKFPKLDYSQWKKISENPRNGFTFAEYERE